MKSRPILFSSPMVRAILDGTKTQTRRIVKPQLETTNDGYGGKNNWISWSRDDGKRVCPKCAFMARFQLESFNKTIQEDGYCPYGQPGDRLWVRETFRPFDSSVECACYDDCQCARMHGKPIYRATSPDDEGPWKPSIFMPRAASRITLEITGIRVERLNQLSREDAVAEGCGGEYDAEGNMKLCPYVQYLLLWESINGKGSWERNPWVWVVSFKRI